MQLKNRIRVYKKRIATLDRRCNNVEIDIEKWI